MKIKSFVWYWLAMACFVVGLLYGLGLEGSFQTLGTVSDGAFITAMVLILLAIFFMRLGFAAEAREKRRRKVHQQPRNTVKSGSMVCSKQLFKEALGHTYDEPKRWQLHNINEIMNTVVTGWKPFSNPRMFAGYGRQKGWERDVSGNELPGNEDGFVELSEEECLQLELPKEWIA